MTKWGDFELRREIGRGAFGAVYCAFHPTLRQEVALKLIPVPSGDPHDIERALDEPRRLASIRHQHVVVVHDARYSSGHVGICMELIRGETLAEIVARRGPFGVDETIACGARLCRALSAIHRALLVHNDVKAQNVMREDGGRIVLMDFGAGRSLHDAETTAGPTFLGTPVYMAPELFELAPPSPSSDIYSLGVLLFYALTGRYPVEGTTMAQLAGAHAAGARRHISDLRDDVSARLVSVLERALQRDPADRYQTTGEMLEDLTARSSRGVRHARRARWEPPRRPESAVTLPAAQARADTLRTSFAGRPRLLAAFAAAALAGIWAFGFLASKAYAVMFGLHGDFVKDTPADWLEVGIRTLPLPVAYMVMAVAACVIGKFAWRLLRRLLPPVDRWSHRMASKTALALSRAGLSEPGAAAAAVLLAQIALLALVYWSFFALISAFSTPIADGAIPAHARLAPSNENEWLLFRGVTSLLALASGVVWALLIARYRVLDGTGIAAAAAGLALTLVFVAMFAVPWRIVHQASFQTARFGADRCFVVSEAGSNVLLHCPDRSELRTIVVGGDDSRLERSSARQNIFSAAPAGARAIP